MVDFHLVNGSGRLLFQHVILLFEIIHKNLFIIFNL